MPAAQSAPVLYGSVVASVICLPNQVRGGPLLVATWVARLGAIQPQQPDHAHTPQATRTTVGNQQTRRRFHQGLVTPTWRGDRGGGARACGSGSWCCLGERRCGVACTAATPWARGASVDTDSARGAVLVSCGRLVSSREPGEPADDRVEASKAFARRSAASRLSRAATRSWLSTMNFPTCALSHMALHGVGRARTSPQHFAATPTSTSTVARSSSAAANFACSCWISNACWAMVACCCAMTCAWWVTLSSSCSWHARRRSTVHCFSASNWSIIAVACAISGSVSMLAMRGIDRSMVSLPAL